MPPARDGSRLQTGDTGSRTQSARPPGRRQLASIYKVLVRMHGPQQWWPTAAEDGEGRQLEICFGAILTQNTSWRGAAAALDRLRSADCCSLPGVLDTPDDVLADLVRPSGYFRAKARKLKAFAETVVSEYGAALSVLFDGDADTVRARLLDIWGIGPETADAITLYAARLPTFVVDAYAYRLFERLGLAPGPRTYDLYRSFFLSRIGSDVWRLNEWHALIVRQGQLVCRRSAPRCEECELVRRCAFGRQELGLSPRKAARASH